MLRELARDYQLHLIIALPVIWFIVFKYLPMYGAQIAFRDFAAAKGIWGSPWVGLDHFKRFFESYLFWRIVGNTFFLSIYTLAATFPIPILLALSINNANNRMFRKAVQMIIYAPYFISTVVMVGLLIQFLSTSVGVVGPLMLALGTAGALVRPRWCAETTGSNRSHAGGLPIRDRSWDKPPCSVGDLSCQLVGAAGVPDAD